MKEAGDVSCSEHALGRSSSHFVDDDSVIDRQAGPLSELRPWAGADRNQVGCRGRFDPQPQIDAMLAVQSGDGCARVGTKRSQHRLRKPLGATGLAFPPAADRRYLASAEPRTG